MNHRLSLLALVLLIAGAVAFGLFWTPSTADAGQCFPCSSGSPTTTPVVTVTDVDCMWSENKARTQLLAMAPCDDGYCVQSFITTEACHWVGPNQYRVGMKLTYQCRECINPDGF